MKKQPTNKLFSHAEHMVKGLFVDHFRLDYFKGTFFQYSSTPLLQFSIVNANPRQSL